MNSKQFIHYSNGDLGGIDESVLKYVFKKIFLRIFWYVHNLKIYGNFQKSDNFLFIGLRPEQLSNFLFPSNWWELGIWKSQLFRCSLFKLHMFFSEASSKIGKIPGYQEKNLPDHLSWRIPKVAQILALTSKVAQIPVLMPAVAQLSADLFKEAQMPTIVLKFLFLMYHQLLVMLPKVTQNLAM